MKYLNLKKHLAILAIIAFTFSACKKIKTAEPMGDAGQTLVKIWVAPLGGSLAKKPIDFISTPSRILAVEVRREIPSEAELNKTMVVTVKDDTAAVRAKNPAYIQFPAAWYTVDIDGIKTGGQGGTFTFTFRPGEFSKSIYIVIPNATLLNPSALYGLGFTVLTADAGGKIADQKSAVVEIGAKNAYDGIYSYVSGLVTRYSAPGVPLGDALSGDLAGNPDVTMTTIGANTVSIPVAGSQGALYWAFGNNSQVAGIDGLSVTVDPATNLVTMVSAGNATLTNWAGHVNDYNPATKTFRLAFRWNPTANVREYEVVFKYKSARP